MEKLVANSQLLSGLVENGDYQTLEEFYESNDITNKMRDCIDILLPIYNEEFDNIDYIKVIEAIEYLHVDDMLDKILLMIYIENKK